jgi:hypothetical protein
MGQQQQDVTDRESTGDAAIMQNSDVAEPAALQCPVEDMGNDPSAALTLPPAPFISPPTEALNVFVQAIEGAHYPSPDPPGWWLAIAIKKFDGLCAYCDRNAGSALDVDPMIPAVAGGPQRPDAAVLACDRCKRKRKRRDLLLWKPDASARLRTLRAQLALDSWNHVSRDPAAMQTPAKAAEVIAVRWKHPRFHCHGTLLGTGGFIGWRDPIQVPSAISLRITFDYGGWRLRQSAKRTNLRNNTAAIFWIPTLDGALSALWDVIEHNGLVRRVAIDEAPSPSHHVEPDPASDWGMVFPTIADLVQRGLHQP